MVHEFYYTLKVKFSKFVTSYCIKIPNKCHPSCPLKTEFQFTTYLNKNFLNQIGCGLFMTRSAVPPQDLIK